MKYLIIIMPLIGTIIGTLSIYLIKKENQKLIKKAFGFSAGVMLVASFLSLINPSIEISKNWFPPTFGILLGIFIILSLDLKINKNNKNSNLIIIIAIILHNIPEGIATGVGLAGSLTNIMSLKSAFTLSLAITLHNIPEGIVVGLLNTKNKKKTIKYGLISGLVEPLFASITSIITIKINNLMPYLFALAGGAMIYVIVDELVPESKDKNSKIGIISFTIGFTVMLLLELLFS